MNPYKILDVPKKASAAQIKSAYRRRAMQTHPDRGNDGSEFALVAKAYAVLSDPEQRRRFDETGSIDEVPALTLHQKMVSLLAHCLAQALQETTQSRANIKAMNMVEMLRKFAGANLAEARKKLDHQRALYANAELLLKRVTRKDEGENLFATILRKQMAELDRPIRENVTTVQAFERLIEELQHYQSEVEVMQAMQVMAYGPGAFQATDTTGQSVYRFWAGDRR